MMTAELHPGLAAGRTRPRPGRADPARRDRPGPGPARRHVGADHAVGVARDLAPPVAADQHGDPRRVQLVDQAHRAAVDGRGRRTGDPEGGPAGHRQSARRRRRRLARRDPGRPPPPLRRVARRTAPGRHRRAEGVRRVPDRRVLARCRCHHPLLDDLDVEWRIAGVAAERHGRALRSRAPSTARSSTAASAPPSARRARCSTRSPTCSADPGSPGRRCSASPSTPMAASRRSPGSGSPSGCSRTTTTRSLRSSGGATDEIRVRLLRALADGADDGRWRVGLIGARLAAAGSISAQAAIRPS